MVPRILVTHDKDNFSENYGFSLHIPPNLHTGVGKLIQMEWIEITTTTTIALIQFTQCYLQSFSGNKTLTGLNKNEFQRDLKPESLSLNNSIPSVVRLV